MALTANRKERLTSLAGVALLHLALGWALLLSLAPALVQNVSDPLDVFNVREVPPPPPDMPPAPKLKTEPEPGPAPPEPEGASAPPAMRREAPPVAASKRVADRDVPPPVAAGLVPFGAGSSGDSSSDSDGDGTGSGGSGSGSGSGNAGSGSGGGGSGGTGAAVVRPQWRSGAITRRDYPKAANGDQGVVEARLTVSATGSVTGCSVTRSSGNAVLDATTCRLIRQRFRFTPARDARGNAVPDEKGWRQRWWRD